MLPVQANGGSQGPTGVTSATIIEPGGAQPSDQFGSIVAALGDVNRDGYADFVIGTGPATGKAYLFLGSATGLVPPTVAFAQGNGISGDAVAAVGDVNGDGFADVAVDGATTNVLLR